MLLHVGLCVQNHKQTSTAANVGFIPGKAVFFKISNYAEELQVVPSWQSPRLLVQFPAEEEATLTLPRMEVSSVLKRGARGHMEVVWAQEGVKAGAHHCWMLLDLH